MADAEEKLIDHLKQVWANGIALYTKAEGYSLIAEGKTMLATHHNYKRVARKVIKCHHTVGHCIRVLNEVPPASIDRVAELNEIPDAKTVPDIHDINVQMYQDFSIQRDRLIKAIKRAHDVDQYGISSVLKRYVVMLDHYMWHALAATERVAPAPDEDLNALGQAGTVKPEKI